MTRFLWAAAYVLGWAMLAGVVAAMLIASNVPFLEGLFHDSRQPWAILSAAALVCLLGAADANARELLGTMGYFSPTLTIALKETPGGLAPRAITVDVDPGPQTRIASADIAFTGQDLRLLPQAIAHARRGRRIVNQNIVLSLLIIAALPPLAITGVLGLAAVGAVLAARLPATP